MLSIFAHKDSTPLFMQVLRHLNASGPAPLMYRGSWQAAAAAWQRWHTPEGDPRCDRPAQWWGYAAPQQSSPAPALLNGAPAPGSALNLTAAHSFTSTSSGDGGLPATGQQPAAAPGNVSASGFATWASSQPPLQQDHHLADSTADESFYLNWILQDLEPWTKHGIKEV